MSNVLFANTYFYKLDQKQWRFKQPYPPLGTLQAAAVIRQEGFETSVFDASLQDSPEVLIARLQSEQPDFFVIYDDGFNYLTKMCLTVMREAAYSMATMAKQEGCVVIINSSDSTDHYEKYFERGVDYVIRGEGEETLKELLSRLSKKEDIDVVQGLAFMRESKSIVNSPRPVLRELNSLPLPAWDLIDLTSYQKIWKDNHGYFSLNLATTRGCPYKCNWCAKPIYGNRYNSRTPEHVINEIEFLIKNYHPDHFWMCDDIFGLKPGWVASFRDLVKEKNLSFRYKIQSRVDLIVEKNVVISLAESGCETVWLGAESGSQKILDAMDKGTSLEQIHDATQLLKKYGIKAAYFLQFGYPGEERGDIDSTLSMVLREMPDEIGISVSYPLPGTKFYENVKAHLFEKKNWTDSDDLEMLYENTFPLTYYKILQRYVHSRYRIQRGLYMIKCFLKKPTTGLSARKMVSMMYHIPVSLLQRHQLKRLSATHA